MPRLSLLLLGVVVLAGCNGPLTMRQRLVGSWVGRTETAEERVLREWPGEANPEDPEVVAALADTPTTDLEQAGPVTVSMTLGELGDAELTLDGGQPLAGSWSLTPLGARRAELELVVERGEAGPERRRFELQLLRSGNGFTLRESGSDPRFGRLLFAPASN